MVYTRADNPLGGQHQTWVVHAGYKVFDERRDRLAGKGSGVWSGRETETPQI